jgi:hypothetical protein
MYGFLFPYRNTKRFHSAKSKNLIKRTFLPIMPLNYNTCPNLKRVFKSTPIVFNYFFELNQQFYLASIFLRK